MPTNTRNASNLIRRHHDHHSQSSLKTLSIISSGALRSVTSPLGVCLFLLQYNTCNRPAIKKTPSSSKASRIIDSPLIPKLPMQLPRRTEPTTLGPNHASVPPRHFVEHLMCVRPTPLGSTLSFSMTSFSFNINRPHTTTSQINVKNKQFITSITKSIPSPLTQALALLHFSMSRDQLLCTCTLHTSAITLTPPAVAAMNSFY